MLPGRARRHPPHRRGRADARFEGERLSGRAKGTANADWLTIGHDGTAALDVRALLETDDGALVFIQYTGRLHLAEQTTYATPLFETGDDRYTWLNQVQAVGKGKTDGDDPRLRRPGDALSVAAAADRRRRRGTGPGSSRPVVAPWRFMT